MKTLMILLLTISSVRCFAQKPENKDVTEKKRTIKPVRIYDPKLMPVDCTASGVKICSGLHNYSFTRNDFDKLPVWDFRDMIAVLPGVYQPRRGAIFWCKGNWYPLHSRWYSCIAQITSLYMQ